MKNVLKKALLTAAVGGLGLAVGTAKADTVYTNVNNAPGGEATIAQVLSGIFAGVTVTGGQNDHKFTYSASGNYVTFTRVADGGSDTTGINLLGSASGVNDQIWHDGIAGVTAEARWAGYGQVLGIRQGSLDTNLLRIDGSGANPAFTNLVAPPILTGSVFDWYRANDTSGANKQYSNPGLNSGTKDHMITFEVTSNLANIVDPTDNNQHKWVIMFEDLTDFDFNDSAYLITASTNQNAIPPAPVPAAVWMGGAGLLAVAGLKAKRARKERA